MSEPDQPELAEGPAGQQPPPPWWATPGQLPPEGAPAPHGRQLSPATSWVDPPPVAKRTRKRTRIGLAAAAAVILGSGVWAGATIATSGTHPRTAGAESRTADDDAVTGNGSDRGALAVPGRGDGGPRDRRHP